MITVIDDVLQDPDFYNKFALQQIFYENEKHPLPQHLRGLWKGKRTELIHMLDDNLFVKLFNEISKKIIDTTFGKQNRLSFDYGVTSYFHLLDQSCKFDESWIHQDDNCIYAGIVYLNKIGSHQGTLIFDGEERKVIDNKYNRCVFYDANYKHSALDGSGSSLDDSRLTINFFVKNFTLTI